MCYTVDTAIIQDESLVIILDFALDPKAIPDKNSLPRQYPTGKILALEYQRSLTKESVTTKNYLYNKDCCIVQYIPLIMAFDVI